ncbi:glycoside hydrolase family 19 protein [Bacillus sp. SS-TM]
MPYSFIAASICGNQNYAAENLVPTFGKHRITAQQAAALGRTATQPANQKAIANLVYGGEWGKKNLGNQVAGDGWKYRGRGLKQITGLSNYRSCGQALKLDLVTHPELLEQDDYAARSAAWFYVSRGCMLHSGLLFSTLLVCLRLGFVGAAKYVKAQKCRLLCLQQRTLRLIKY